MLAVVLVAVVALSLPKLTTFPRIFYDEGITIEIARNFQLFGVADISTSPGQFTDAPYINASSGFPVTAPLALFFRIFGFGLTQARVYALLWLLVCIVAVYIFSKRLWGNTHAIAAVLLIVTFAPLYDNGRRVLGEIPGFVFLLTGLFLLMWSQKTVIAGLFLGLAMVSKPSIYLLIAPAMILAAIFINRDLRKKIIPLLIGMSPITVIWIWLAFPNPLSLDTWRHVLLYYQNPNVTSLSENIFRNISLFVSQTTLIYFSLLAIGIGLVLFPRRRIIGHDVFLSFLIPYVALSLVYFLKSPGWLKYLLPLELLILMILPGYLRQALDRIHRAELYRTCVVLLVLFQGLHLMFFSNITNASNEAEMIASYVSKQSGMIGVIKSPQIAALIPPDRKIQYLPYNERYRFGSNPLDLPIGNLPRFLIFPSGYENTESFSREQKDKLQYYTLIRNGGWDVFELK